MTPSPEQQAGIDALHASRANLLFSCPAGGGKTTLMTMLARSAGPAVGKVVALAFNKDAATALEAKMPYWVECSTFHSFCYSALGAALGRKPKPDGRRCAWLLKDLVPDWKERRTLEDAVLTLVSRAKSIDPDTDVVLSDLADHFGIEADTRACALAERVLELCATPPFKSVDFDDMLWLAAKLRVPFPHVALTFLDEAQDTNGMQRALLRSMLNRDGARFIAVGDPHQSIYGFRGADHDAMAALKREFNMTELPLSVSYRCSRAVVREAQKYL